jgi:hypothetical protein
MPLLTPEGGLPPYIYVVMGCWPIKTDATGCGSATAMVGWCSRLMPTAPQGGHLMSRNTFGGRPVMVLPCIRHGDLVQRRLPQGC